MVGEFLRELAVLVLVFVPLESYRGLDWKRWQLSLAITITVLLAIGILTIGIALERNRP
jgi:hypothetical protein